jgi:cobyrinic acid a,c-diamide synthase
MNILHNTPRLVIAGLAGDSGKSAVSMAILHQCRKAGLSIRAFKKGPDYIDAAWLSRISGEPARNLDSWLMGADGSAASFHRHSVRDGLNLVEGNRGLFDGADSSGTHSTAELAKSIRAPVLLVVNVTKMTRTAAALVLGCQHLDPDLRLAGVVINRVHGARHESVLRAAIESATGLPVLGAIPALANGILPNRHLGLVTPSDHQGFKELTDTLETIAAELDIRRIMELATGSAPLDIAAPNEPPLPCRNRPNTRIAIVRDAAFNFYYPENIEALAAGGAELVFVSALEAAELPPNLDAIYIGGGFPEVHAAGLAANRAFLNALAGAANGGLPIYAECGGLMLLARSIEWKGTRHPMSAVLPMDVTVDAHPQGHGYVDLSVTEPNPFFPQGTTLRGHEFHYSNIIPQPAMPRTACAVRRGTGAYDKRDGVIQGNVWASYTHLHATATPEWADAILRVARKHQENCRKSEQPISGCKTVSP